MSGIKNIHPVLKCKRCGTPVIVKELQIYEPDPEGVLLRELLRNMEKSALCEFHQRQRDYYAGQGRLQDWENGNL
jgi:hypothetical protein